jgi:hypothetical protein
MANPSVEIRLKDGHRQPIRGSRITSFNVPEWSGVASLKRILIILSRSTEVGWNDVVPFARVVAPEQDLKTATKPEDVTEQEERMLLSFKSTVDRVPSVSRSLEALWNAFGAKFQGATTLKNMQDICSSKSYLEFHEAVTDIYSGDIKALEAEASAFRNFVQLSDQSTVILSMRSYLEQAELPSDDARRALVKASIQNR